MRLSVWCEFLPYDDVIGLLPALAKRSIGLNLAVQPDRARDPAFFRLLAEAATAGTEVRAWVLLGTDDGYWPSAWNADRAALAVRGLVEAARAAGTPLPWVVLDLEPPPEMMQELGARLARWDVLGAWRSLCAPEGAGGSRRSIGPAGRRRSQAQDEPQALELGRSQAASEPQALEHGPGSAGVSPASRSGRAQSSFEAANAVYAHLIAELQAAGTRVQAVTLPMALDGPAAGRLLAALGIPLFGLPWDEVSLMAYRPEFVRLAGPMGADLVARYARAAVKTFGPRASLAIGEIGTPGFPVPAPGYTDPADLQADLAACRAAGLESVSIFSLEGLLEQGGIEPWLDAAPVPPPGAEIRPALVRTAIDAICRVLPRTLPQ